MRGITILVSTFILFLIACSTTKELTGDLAVKPEVIPVGKREEVKLSTFFDKTEVVPLHSNGKGGDEDYQTNFW